MVAMFNGQPVIGPQGQPGENATINGQNTLEIVAGKNVSIEQQDSTMMISAEEVYSTEETKIGTWANGKPIYRKCAQITITSSVQGDTVPPPPGTLSDDTETIISFGGTLIRKKDNNLFSIIGNFGLLRASAGWRVRVSIGAGTYSGTVYIDYTKTTDTATKTVAAPLSISTHELSSNPNVMASTASVASTASTAFASFEV